MLSLLLACTPSSPTLALSEGDDWILREISVFDGASVIGPFDVLIEDGRVRELAPPGAGTLPGAAELDGRGRTVLPGYVDAHTHLGSPTGAPGELALPDPTANLEAWLATGVTTVFDMGGHGPIIAPLAEASAAGTLAAPTIHRAPPPITQADGHPFVVSGELLPFPLAAIVARLIIAVETPADAPDAMARALEGHPDYIKLIFDQLPPGVPELSDESVASLVAEAHAHRRKVAVHIGDARELRVAVAAGADLIAHGPYRGGLPDDVIAEVAAAGVPVVATLAGFQATIELGEGTWTPSDLDTKLWPEVSAATPAGAHEFADVDALRRFAEAIDRDMAENMRRLSDAGVPILVGSDAPLPGMMPGSGFHRELQSLAAAGVPPAALLAAATTGPSDALGLGGPAHAPRPGAVADLVIVEGDPVADISRASQVATVLRAGRQVIPIVD